MFICEPFCARITSALANPDHFFAERERKSRRKKKGLKSLKQPATRQQHTLFAPEATASCPLAASTRVPQLRLGGETDGDERRRTEAPAPKWAKTTRPS